LAGKTHSISPEFRDVALNFYRANSGEAGLRRNPAPDDRVSSWRSFLELVRRQNSDIKIPSGEVAEWLNAPVSKTTEKLLIN
jgi:hypothetical protein